jgi:CheY-like chemotaxis protein
MAAKNTTVLLVEDNEDNLLIYSTILRHSGYTVLEARDGQAGIDAAKNEHPGLILMDVSIPIIDGLEATRRLKADPGTKDIPIIALTAHALASDQQKATEAGCDAYIAKPAEPRAVVAAVKKYLGEAGAAAAAP